MFWSILIEFSPWVSIQLTPIFIVLDLFTPILTTLDLIGSIFHHMLDPQPKDCWSPPPPYGESAPTDKPVVSTWIDNP